MGCGGSKTQVQTPEPVPQPPPPPPVPQPEEQIHSDPKPEPEPVKEPPKVVAPDETDPDEGKPPVLSSSLSLAALLQMVVEGRREGDLTPAQLVKEVLRAQTAKTRSRFTELASKSDVISPPLYYVWTHEDEGEEEGHAQEEQQHLPPQPSTQQQHHQAPHMVQLARRPSGWDRSMRELVGTVQGHIQHMEPGLNPSSVGIWVSPFCANHNAPPRFLRAALRAARQALEDPGSGIRPTLMCMQQGREGGSSLESPGHQGGQPGSSDTYLTAASPAPDGAQNKQQPRQQDDAQVYVQANGSTHADLSQAGALQSVQGPSGNGGYRRVLTVYRSPAGLHGFLKSRFNTCQVAYLD